MSKIHCSFEFVDGAWQVRDCSSNGTFVNYSESPIGRGAARRLVNHDRLLVGPYEIEFSESTVELEDGEGGANVEQWGWGQDNDQEVQKKVRPDSQQLDDGAGRGGWWDDPSPEPILENAPAPPDSEREKLPIGRLPESGSGRTDDGSSAMPSDMPAMFLAFLEGANLPPGVAVNTGADHGAAMARAGALTRALVAGVRSLLVARDEVMREFRIERTMLRQANNNPLKFSASDELALEALLGLQSPADMIVRKTIDDLVSHQVASLAATQAAARSLLQAMSPANVETSDAAADYSREREKNDFGKPTSSCMRNSLNNSTTTSIAHLAKHLRAPMNRQRSVIDHKSVLDMFRVPN